MLSSKFRAYHVVRGGKGKLSERRGQAAFAAPMHTEILLSQQRTQGYGRFPALACPLRLSAPRLPLPLSTTMSLQEASDARKARLLALKKRKAGEAVDDTYVL